MLVQRTLGDGQFLQLVWLGDFVGALVLDQPAIVHHLGNDPLQVAVADTKTFRQLHQLGAKNSLGIGPC